MTVLNFCPKTGVNALVRKLNRSEKPAPPRFLEGYFVGSEGDNGQHLRDSAAGWPYSIYRADNNIGGCDAVLCRGIQDIRDAAVLAAALNGKPFTLDPRQMLSWE